MQLHLFTEPDPLHEIANVAVLVVCRCGETFSGLSEGGAFTEWCKHIEEHEQ